MDDWNWCVKLTIFEGNPKWESKLIRSWEFRVSIDKIVSLISYLFKHNAIESINWYSKFNGYNIEV